MSSSRTEFGLPLVTPSSQTILPVVVKLNSTTTIPGFFAIPKTEFDGTETSFQVQTGTGGTVTVESVTLPTKIQVGVTGHPEVRQFMAATYDYEESVTVPWNGYTSFVPNTSTGYYSRWSTPTGVRKHWYDPGSLVGSFYNGMDFYPTYVPTEPETPTANDGVLRWAVSLNLADVGPACTFFDFNWVTLFETAMIPASTEGGTNGILPLSIITSTQPPGGEFRAAILQRPEYVAGGGTMSDTIRILRMTETVAAGDYTFQFTISSTTQGVATSTTAELTLTVV